MGVNDRSTVDARGGKWDGGCTGVDAHLAVPVGADFVVSGRVWYHSTALVTARSAVRVPALSGELFWQLVATSIGIVQFITIRAEADQMGVAPRALQSTWEGGGR